MLLREQDSEVAPTRSTVMMTPPRYIRFEHMWRLIRQDCVLDDETAQKRILGLVLVGAELAALLDSESRSNCFMDQFPGRQKPGVRGLYFGDENCDPLYKILISIAWGK